jgi:acyl transferase domain-containing protein/acyl carrier protein
MDDSQDDRSRYDVAVIGLAGRFPGAASIAQLWTNLSEGRESIRFFSEQELRSAGTPETSLKAPGYVRARGILDGIEQFDAEFFGYSAREAERTGPQQRLFLEACWEVLEVAGYDPGRYEGQIGVFAGAPRDRYPALGLGSRPPPSDSAAWLLEAIGNDSEFLTTQISYRLGLRGPSLAIQTACSTSLVAVHLACQSLIHRECDLALAGGVSISLPQTAGYLHQEGGIESPDGHCRAFDALAAGSVPGNGLGVVLLRRLGEALAAGDHIHAVIRGSAINNDGSQKVGFTAPSVDGQAEVIAEALAVAGFEPSTVSYVQCHGTGTNLGDPVEIAALRQAFHTERKGYCAIGSAKTNLGHLGAAAGVVGLITAVLALENERIPPSLHFERPNPELNLGDGPFYVNTKLLEWPRGDAVRRAAVSSFGIGGTNAHVALEEAPRRTAASPRSPWQLLVLSTRTAPALVSAAARLATYLDQNPLLSLDDVAHTLRVGRRPFAQRCAVVCRDAQEAVASLKGREPGRFIRGDASDEARVVFMFPGQGAQYPGMGRDLYRTQKVFRREVDLCAEVLEPLVGESLLEALHGEASAMTGMEEALSDTRLAQPALFTVEYALARLWQSWGVEPEAMIGHSIGEYVAACLAGVFELEDALHLVALRARLMQAQPRGAMVAVALSGAQVVSRLTGSLALAAVNAASLCVVSGPEPEVDSLATELGRQGIACQRVKTSHAFHGPMMEAVIPPFAAAVRQVRRSSPRLPLISNLTGTWMTPEEATDPEYWARQLREPVLFADACTVLLADTRRLFLEVGPGRTLQALVRQAPGGAERLTVTTLPRPGERDGDSAVFLRALGQLWTAGVPVDWSGFESDGRRRVPLPTYPFERQGYWLEPQEPLESAASVSGRDLEDWFYVPSWRRSIPVEYLAQGPEAGLGSWLVFRDTSGLADELARKLEARSSRVLTVTAGDRFERVAERRFVIRPRQREDYAVLFAELARDGTALQGIAHTWPLEPAGPNDEAFDPQGEGQALGFFSLLFLAQAIGEAGFPHGLRLEVVSTGLCSVTGQEMLCPSRATLLGPCRVIPQEYPGITCRVYDVLRGGEQGQLAEQLATEFASQPRNGVVAYRHGHRWVPAFDRLPRGTGNHPSPVKDGGVYLVLGGVEDPGLAVAEYLAARGARCLVLLSQPEAPSGPFANGAERAIEQVKERLATLEARGVRLVVEAVDAADLAAMEGVVSRTEERFGPICGAVHAALAPSAGLMQFKTMQAAARVLATKARGAYVLQRVLESRSPDFLVLFGSSTGITGIVGQVDDCGANAFLDAFSCALVARGHSGTLVLDLPPWRRPSEPERPPETSPLPALAKEIEEQIGITLGEGLAVLDRVLGATLPQIVVSRHDFGAMVERQSVFTASQLLQQLGVHDRKGSRRGRPTRAGEFVPPSNETEAAIATVWEELFGFEPIGSNDDFFELGGHSLLAIEMISRLREALGAEIPLGLVFESSRLASLAGMIAGDVPEGKDREQFEELLREVETLSPEEVARLLQAEAGASINPHSTGRKQTVDPQPLRAPISQV